MMKFNQKFNLTEFYILCSCKLIYLLNTMHDIYFMNVIIQYSNHIHVLLEIYTYLNNTHIIRACMDIVLDSQKYEE